MKTHLCRRLWIFTAISVVATLLAGSSLAEEPAAGKTGTPIRVATYNVEFSANATAEEIGEMLKPYRLDVVGFTEAPAGDWAKRVGKILGMEHQFRGESSSANHKDKYKIILSRTRLEETKEVMLPGTGWQPASAVRATSTIHGTRFAIYCLHICASKEKGGQAFHLADEVLAKEAEPHVLVMGDFNNQMNDAAMLHLKKAGLKATWDSLPVDLAKSFTWNAKDPKSREGVIDHILYRESSRATVTAGGIIELEKPLSDHKPVWAELRMP